MFLALAVATAVYVAVSLGVLGTLTADQVVAAGPSPLAGAAKPTLGQLVYVLMLVVLFTALLSTVVTFVVFCTTTLVDEPATSLALVVLLALALLMDLGWKRRREHDGRGQSAEHRLSA